MEADEEGEEGDAAVTGQKVKDVHAQDPIHVAKRMKNQIDSITRDLTFGDGAVASMAALDSLRIYGNLRGPEVVDTGLVLKNTQQKDRQNWPSAQAILRRKVRHALWQHQPTVGGLQGLIVYLEMAWKYTNIFFSRVITFRERIEHACYVIHFLRLWRAWVFLQPGYTVTANFLTRQTFMDTVMSCHSAILVILFYAAMHPDTPLHMDRIGTDCVEKHFSSQGSWVVNKRSYNFLQMLQMLHKMNWLGAALTEGKVRAPQVAHHNDEPWRKEDLAPDCACFGCKPSVESASVQPDFSVKTAADEPGAAEKPGCPCPVADCTNPDSCKNDVVGTNITWVLVAEIWVDQFRKAAATLSLVGVGPRSKRKGEAETKSKRKGEAETESAEKAEGDGESLFDGPAALERWLRSSGWWSDKDGSDKMAADEADDADEGTDNRPDSSLVGRYIRVPEAHFTVAGGCEQVFDPDDTSRCMGKVTKFKHATPVLRSLALFEAIVDCPGVAQTTAYMFNVEQVLAYVLPANFQPSTEQEENLAYEHADIGKRVGEPDEEGASKVNQPEGGGASEEDEGGRSGEGQSEGGGEMEADGEVDPYCLMPDGKGGVIKKHKSTVVAHLSRCLGMGVKLSSDRLIAVRGVVRTEPLAAGAEAEAAKGGVNRNVISIGCHVVVEAESDGNKGYTQYYIARVLQMAKRWPGGAGGKRSASTPYYQPVALGGKPKAAAKGVCSHLFPLEVGPESPGAKNLEVKLKWMNRIPPTEAFKLGGMGGDQEWHNAHLILGTINMVSYAGSARTIKAACPANGWAYHFSIESDEKTRVFALLDAPRRKKKRDQEVGGKAKGANAKGGKAKGGKAAKAQKKGPGAQKKGAKAKTMAVKRKAQKPKAKKVQRRKAAPHARTRQRCMCRPPTRNRKFDSTLGYPGEGHSISEKLRKCQGKVGRDARARAANRGVGASASDRDRAGCGRASSDARGAAGAQGGAGGSRTGMRGGGGGAAQDVAGVAQGGGDCGAGGCASGVAGGGSAAAMALEQERPPPLGSCLRSCLAEVEQARAREGATWENVSCGEAAQRDALDDGCGAHVHSMYSHFTYESQAERRNDIYEQSAAEVGRLPPKEAELTHRSPMRQREITRALQTMDPFCWQPLPPSCKVVDAFTSAIATAGQTGELVCIVQRCALAGTAAKATKVGLELLRFHTSHARPEAAALWTENEASKFCHPVSYEGKTGNARRQVTWERENAATPMQYEDRCVLAGTHFQYQEAPCGDETLRTAKVRSCAKQTHQCMLSEEGSMEIMVTMNKLVLELLPKVPDFGLAELQELAVGTHTHNRDCIKEVIVEAEAAVVAEKGRKRSRKRRKTRRDANKVGARTCLCESEPRYHVLTSRFPTHRNCWCNTNLWEH